MALTARDPFHDDLRRAAGEYLADRSARDVPAMYLKAAILIAWLVGAWALLVFAPVGPVTAVLLAIAIGLGYAGVGMAVTHDANHGALSRRRWVNRLFGFGLDLLGGSSYVWRVKHNIVHHTYTNVAGVDDDLEVGPFARLSASHRRRRAHRIQHLYLWVLYGGLHLKWAWVDDWVALAAGRITQHPLRRPGALDLIQLVAGKLLYIGWALVIPLLFHPIVDVLVLYLIASVVGGATIAMVFQLAHCVEEAEFPATADGGFATHQLATTVDFAPKNWLVSWYVGGLNFQVEHHLFPRVSHVHYPALAQIVSQVAARHGLRHRVMPTVGDALASHFRHLRRLGTIAVVPDLSQGAPGPSA